MERHTVGLRHDNSPSMSKGDLAFAFMLLLTATAAMFFDFTYQFAYFFALISVAGVLTRVVDYMELRAGFRRASEPTANREEVTSERQSKTDGCLPVQGTKSEEEEEREGEWEMKDVKEQQSMHTPSVACSPSLCGDSDEEQLRLLLLMCGTSLEEARSSGREYVNTLLRETQAGKIKPGQAGQEFDLEGRVYGELQGTETQYANCGGADIVKAGNGRG